MTAREPTLRELISPIVRDIVAETKSDVLLISQQNVETILGISRRTHLENCRRSDFTPRVVRVGKMRLVDASEYRAWLLAQGTRDSREAEDDVEDGASQLLAELGFRETAKPQKKIDPRHETRDRRVHRVG